VIEAEDAAIEHYNKFIELCNDAHGYVTQDLCLTVLTDEVCPAVPLYERVFTTPCSSQGISCVNPPFILHDH